MKRFILGALALLAASLLSGPSLAQGNSCQGGGLVGMVVGGTQTGGACYYVKVNSDGSINTAASGSGTDNVNLAQVNGVTVNVGVGAAGTGTQRVTTSTDSTIATITNPVGLKGLDGSTIATGFNPIPVLLAPSATQGVSTQSCTVACASSIVSGGHGLYGLTFSSTVAGWLLIYDDTSCAANGTVTPKKAFAYTVANTTMGVSWNNAPMIDLTGTAACFSTTGPFTATASTTAYISLDYK